MSFDDESKVAALNSRRANDTLAFISRIVIPQIFDILSARGIYPDLLIGSKCTPYVMRYSHFHH